MRFRLARTFFRNGLIYLGLLLLVGGIVSLLPACSKTDDHEQIASLIAKGASLAEAHDISGILDLTTKDVLSKPVALDRNGLRGLLWRTFKYYGPLKVFYPRPDIDIQDERNSASARFPFLIVKTAQAMPDLEKLRDDPDAWINAIAETADLYRLQLELSRQDGQWQVNLLVLEQFTGLGFE